MTWKVDVSFCTWGQDWLLRLCRHLQLSFMVIICSMCMSDTCARMAHPWPVFAAECILLLHQGHAINLLALQNCATFICSCKSVG